MAFPGKASICAILRILQSTVVETASAVAASGYLDNPSALPCWTVGLYSKVFSYADNRRAHLCSQVAANGGTPFFGPKIAVMGLWSVSKVKHSP